MDIFSESDIKTLLKTVTGGQSSSSALPRPPAVPRTVELVSGGLILEHHAKAIIENSIFSEKDASRITLLELAMLTDLEVKSIEALLPSDDKTEWGRIGSSTIVRKKEFITLRHDLQRRLENTALNVPAYCQEKSLDNRLYRKLLRESFPISEFQWLGHDRDIICTTSFYEGCISELRFLLEGITEPIDVSSLLPDRHLSIAFVIRLLKDILKTTQKPVGTLKGTKYIPHVFEEAKKSALIERLKRDTILDLQSVERAGLQDKSGFCDELRHGTKPEPHFLSSCIVTEEYVAQFVDAIEAKLIERGWVKIIDLDDRLNLVDQKLLGAMIRERGVVDFFDKGFISPQLKASLISVAAEFAAQQAEHVSSSRPQADVRLTTAIKWSDVLVHLSASSSVPVDILTSLSNEIQPAVATKFGQRIADLKRIAADAATTMFCEKGYARFQMHKIALQGLTDSSLRSKLATDLVAYSRELLLGQLDKLEDLSKTNTTILSSPIYEFRAAIQLMGKSSAKPEQLLSDIDQSLKTFMEAMSIPLCSSADVEYQKNEYLRDLKHQLHKTNDPSLALILTLIMLYARLGPGALRASGKYVPKLLKLLQNRVHRELLDDLVGFKDAVISHTQFSEEGFSRLRQIADGSDLDPNSEVSGHVA